MAFKFGLDVDESYDHLSSINLASKLNNRNCNDKEIFRRTQSTMRNMKVREGAKIEFPQYNNQFQMPYLNNVAIMEDKVNLFTPAPPAARNEAEKTIYRMVKKFSKRYEYIWILIANPAHPACAKFAQIYQQQKLSNVNQNLQNLLIPEDYNKVKLFTNQGLDAKILMDYGTYEDYVRREIRSFEEDPRVLDIYIESPKKSELGIIPYRKIKVINDLVAFIQNEMKEDIYKCRKDIAYFNFIHSNSGPELYNRRTIMKTCLSSKSQQQLLENHQLFIEKLEKYTAELRDKQIKQARKKTSFEMPALIEAANVKYSKWSQINKNFSKTFEQYLKKYYPIEEKSQIEKKQFYNWILTQYCIQSAIYSLVNNTIRYSLNTEKVKAISSFVKYLFDALRFHFTTRYRQINYQVVYRGARISLVEQRSFVPGRYMWNLGFMSTSLSKKIAEGFIASLGNAVQAHEKVLVAIELSNLTNDREYLWNQQGFFALSRIPEIRKVILAGQDEVLFNPLNVFQIINWDDENKTLFMKYAPQLQVLEKKKRCQSLLDQEKDLLKSIDKLKDNDFDKGQQLLQQGNPDGAIKYYEQSHDTGTNLTFVQKANYIKGLMEVGDIEKLQVLVNQAIEQEKQSLKSVIQDPKFQSQMSQLSLATGPVSIQKIAHSVQTLTLLQQTTDFEAATQNAQQIKTVTIEKSLQMPSQEVLLLETKTYIQLAKIKYEVSQTVQSIKQSIRSLKIIDQLANVNLCYKLYEVGNNLKRIRNLKLAPDSINLIQILNENKYLNIDIEVLKQQTLKRIADIRNSSLSQQQLSEPPQQSPHKKSQPKTQSKQEHIKAENLLRKYFSKRDQRSQVQKFQESFVYAYWQINYADISKEGVSEKQWIQDREKLKVCRQNLYDIKNDYKELFENEVQAYEVLYRNIYKTSIDVSSCLKSYHKNLYTRYENFIKTEQKHEGNPADTARVLWKHGEILLEYGQIIEKPKLQKNERMTKSQKLGYEKIKQAEEIIQKIETRESQQSWATKKTYTFQKTQINRTITRYFKSKTIQKQRARKLAIIKLQDNVAKSDKLSIDKAYKSDLFIQLVETINTTKQLHESDPNLNQSLFSVKTACQKIQVLNQSSEIEVKNQSFAQRLKSCSKDFEDVMNTIQKYKQKQRMEKNVNMGHLYLLMAQNQFRLGLISNSKMYLKNSNFCLRKALKLDQGQKKRLINEQKLLLGNKTRVGCLRLQSHIVAFFGNQKQKLKLLDFLKGAKSTMFTKMNQPLNEADLNESIGIIASNLLLLYQQLTFDDAKLPFLQAIKIREKLLGPYNKFNARDYTLLVQMMSIPTVHAKYSVQLKNYFENALQIYNRIDFSTDATLILYKMQLQSTYYIYTSQQSQACSTIIYYLTLFDQCPNKQLLLEVAGEMFRSARYLSTQPSYRKQGLFWLKKSYDYGNDLQKFINKQYNLQKKDKRKMTLRKLKIKILKQIVQNEKTNNGKQLQHYSQLLKEEKQLYEKQAEQMNAKQKHQKMKQQ